MMELFSREDLYFLLPVSSRYHQLVITFIQVQVSRCPGLCRCSESKLLAFVRLSFLVYPYPEVVTLQILS